MIVTTTTIQLSNRHAYELHYEYDNGGNIYHYKTVMLVIALTATTMVVVR